MRFDEEIAEFIAGPVMMVIGTRDRANRPDVGRGVGCRVLPGGESVDVLISGWQWPDTVANIRETGEAAFTFVRPSDYRSIQMKGRSGLRLATADDIALGELYIAAATAALAEQGVPPAMTAVWLTNRDLFAARLEVRTVSIKTPGSSAGTLIGAPA